MIQINGQEVPIYPSEYGDDLIVIKSDNFSIKGNIERHRFPSKKQVKMEFTAAAPGQVNFFRGLFEAGEIIEFYNSESNHGQLSFRGIMTECSASTYYRGGSLMTGLSVTIREA